MNSTTCFFLIAGFILIFGFAIIRKGIWNRILEEIGQNHFDQAQSIIRSPLGNLVLSRMNQTTLLLSCAMGNEDVNAVKTLSSHLPKLTAKQEEQILSRTFAWFLSRQDRENALETARRSEKREEKIMQVEILLDHKTNYIQPLSRMIAILPDGPRKGALAYLVSVQYNTLQNSIKAKEYLDLFKACMPEERSLPQEQNPRYTTGYPCKS